MTMGNKNIPIQKYFDALDYEFIETYSFNRGPKFESQLMENNLYMSGLVSMPILNAFKQFNDTANRLAVIRKDTQEHYVLKNIISKQFVGKIDWMCAPFYRDALIFKTNDDQIAESLSICFECGHMQNSNGDYIQADEEVYTELKSLLKSLGHNIQNNEYLQLLEKINEFKKQRQS
jgi:hypothetical protein